MGRKMSDPAENAKRMVKNIIFLSGFFFIMAGTILLTNPQLATDAIGLDRQTAMMIGGALVVAGIGDFAVSRLLFRNIDRR